MEEEEEREREREWVDDDGLGMGLVPVRERKDSRLGVPVGEQSEEDGVRSMNMDRVSGEELNGSID